MMDLDLSNREELEKAINYGNSILAKLFELSDNDLKVKLKSILGRQFYEDIDSCTTIRRIIENEKPKRIEIINWDNIIIDWSGISFQPEHGSEITIRDFDYHFKL